MSNLNVKNIVHPTSGDTTPTENLSKQVCKAWVNFNGTGTVAIRDSYNVSSITDNGVGIYIVNFANAMSDANYSAVCASENTVTVGDGANTTASSFELAIRAINSSAVVDNDHVSVQIFGS